MTRTITVTGGFSGSVVVDLTDTTKQLAYATFKMVLCPIADDDPPPVDTPTWKTATAAPQTASSATLSLPIDGTTAVGQYNIAVDIVADGRHEAVWVADKSNPDARALVIVT